MEAEGSADKTCYVHGRMKVSTSLIEVCVSIREWNAVINVIPHPSVALKPQCIVWPMNGLPTDCYAKITLERRAKDALDRRR